MRTDLLLDQLADMAGQRSREGLDASFLDLFFELFSPRDVAVYRLATIGSRLRWTIRRRAVSPDMAAVTHVMLHPASRELQLHRECWQTSQIKADPNRPTLLVVPMHCLDETHCLIEIETYTPLDAEQIRLIHGAQRFYRHLQGLINENERDALTRLLNRKSFDQNFLEMAIAPLATPADAGSGEPPGGRRVPPNGPQRCWLAIVDIDHFKKVNDTFGHLIGDEVLILIARLLRENFRTDDRLYRFGGEEFVVMLHAPSSELAARALERLRAKIEDYVFPRVGRLTVSIGYTEVKVSDNPSGAFERADECVYHAKSNGRNRIVAYDSLLESHVVQTPQAASEVEFF